VSESAAIRSAHSLRPKRTSAAAAAFLFYGASPALHQVISAQASDKDGDGQISYEEFLAYVRLDQRKAVLGDVQYKVKGEGHVIAGRKANKLVVDLGEDLDALETPR
jgi:hypothetical protein